MDNKDTPVSLISGRDCCPHYSMLCGRQNIEHNQTES